MLERLLSRHARYSPEKTAVVCGECRVSFADFNARVNRVANALLGLGLHRGDTIATILDNSIEVLEIYHAVAKTGLVVVPLSPLLRGDGLVNLLRDSDAQAVITERKMVPHADGVRSRLSIAEDRCLLVDFGRCAGLSIVSIGHRIGAGHRSAVRVDRQGRSIQHHVLEWHDRPAQRYRALRRDPGGVLHGFGLACRMHPESIVLHPGSLVFNGAFLTLMPAWFQGCTDLLERPFDARRTIDAIAREHVTLRAPGAYGPARITGGRFCGSGARDRRESTKRAPHRDSRKPYDDAL